MPLENKKSNSAEPSGYPVYYQKITINYKLGKRYFAIFVFPKEGIFHFFQNNHQNYEPDDHMQPIYSTQKRKAGAYQYDLKKTLFFQHNLPTTSLHTKH